MKIIKYIITPLFVMLVLFSCEKTIDIKIPDNGRKLVLNSLFAADSVLRVEISESRYILDGSSEYKFIEGGKVLLYKNNELLEQLADSSSGIYYGNHILQSGNNYKLEVLKEGYPVLNAENFIPKKTEILKLTAFETSDEYGYPETGFKLTFKDDPNTENYYFISATERRYINYTDPETGEDTSYVDDYKLYVYSYDPNAFADDWYLNEGVVLNDELINGKEYTVQFKSYRNFYDDAESYSVYYVNFCTISKEYYLYYVSLAKHLNAQDEFFMETVQVYTNIENGFGIFAGYSADIDSVIIQN